jgi:hypothetical protein
MFDRLQREVLSSDGGLEEALGDVACVAQRAWTSDQRLEGGPSGPAGRELCALLNAALREDDRALLEAAMPVIRAINSLCVVRGARPEQRLRFPPENRSGPDRMADEKHS